MLHKLKQRKSKEEGFTIIEVLIVLAIAGLIMVVVFMAVPALQRNSRNTQRKSDVQTLLGALQEATNNNGGKLPTIDNAKALAKFGFYDAGDITGNLAQTAAVASVTPTSTGVLVNNFSKCPATMPTDATTAVDTSSGATRRSVTAIYQVETSSGFQSQCLDM